MPDESIPAHGGQLRELAAQFGVREDLLLDFSASINPNPPGDALIETLCRSIRNDGILTRYPDTNYTALKDAIAHYAGVDKDSVCVGNGVIPLLAAALDAIGAHRCLVLIPAFSEYNRVLAACGTDTLALREENAFSVDRNRVLARLKSTGAQALLLANPHSPSGRLTTAAELRQIQEAASELGVTTLIDEAFIDYVPEESLSCAAAQSLRMIVLRSVTKFFAMPGLRVAYAVSHPQARARMEAAMPLWPVDSIAAEAARLALLDAASIDATRRANASERAWLSDQLRAMGFIVFPSSANYLLVKTAEAGDGSTLWRRLLVEHGIVIRRCDNFDGLDQRYFRVGIRTRAENRRMVDALAQICGMPTPNTSYL